jgi:hypothetical protein
MKNAGKPPRYSQEVIEAVTALRFQSVSPTEIGRQFGLDKRAVVRLSKLGGFLDSKKQQTKERHQKIVDLAVIHKKAPAEIARDLGEDPSYIWYVLKPHRDQVRFLQGPPLTPTQEARLIENHNTPAKSRKTNTEIAKEFNTTVAIVKAAKKRLGLRFSSAALRKYTLGDLDVAMNEMGFRFRTSPDPSFRTDDYLHLDCHCGRDFVTLVDSVLRGNVNSCGCIESMPQIEIRELVSSFGFLTLLEDTTAIPGVEIDVYVPDKMVGIEYCGLRFHGELLSKSRTKHQNKFRAALKNGIHLITVFENEWLTKRHVVEAYIKAILGAPATRYGARQCSIEAVSGRLASEFLETHHIQGACTGKSLALRLGDDVLAVLTYKQHKGRIRIHRYCLKTDVQVAGGFERLLAHLVRLHPDVEIDTISDNRWSLGRLYKRCGFIPEAKIKRSYSYFKVNTKGPLISKEHFRKEKLGIAGTDQEEWAKTQELGYDRIWDCGKVRWVLPKTKPATK